MRPNRLSLTAFGPYYQTEVIDFDALLPHDLFVVSGNTGAGKTSIFDGLSFALFGGASGEDRKEALSLRSDFADDELPSSVELIFTINQRQFRVMRQLAYQKTGNKSLTPAKAELYERIEEAGVIKEIPAVDRQMISDVDSKMADLIGLTKEQFNQLVMLPQGEYQRFLTSSTSDKESILRTVFNTEKYRALNEELKTARDLAQKEIDSLAGNINSTLESIFRNLPKRDSPLFTYIDESGQISINPHQALESLQIEEHFYHGEKERLVAMTQTHYTDYQQAQKTLTSSRAVNEKFNQLAVITERFNSHLAQAKTIEIAQQEITLAEKAQPVEKYHDSVTRLRAEAKEQQLKLKSSEEALRQSENVLSLAKAQLQIESDKEAERETLTRAVIQLEANESKVIQLAEKQQRIKGLKQQCQDGAEQLEQAEKVVATLTTQREELQQKISALVLTSEWQIPLMKLSGKVDEIQKSLNRINTSTQKQEHLTVHITEAEAALKAMQSQYDTAYQDWRHAQADQLANAIKPGNACPVCGSLDHPKLHSEIGDIAQNRSPQASILFEDYEEKEKAPLSPHDFAAIDTLFTETQSALVKAEATLTHLQSQSQSLRIESEQQTTDLERLLIDLQQSYESAEFSILSPLNLSLSSLLSLLPLSPASIFSIDADIAIEQIAPLSQKIRDAQKQATNAGITLAKKRAELETIEHSLNQNRESLTMIKEGLRDTETTLKVELQTLALLNAEIPEALQDITQFQSALKIKRETLQRLKAAFTAAEQAFKAAEKEVIRCSSTVSHETIALETLISQGKEARKRLDSELIKAGFSNSTSADEESYLAAKRTPEALSVIRHKVQQYREQLEILKAQKTALETELQAQSPADIPALEALAKLAEERYETSKKATFEIDACLKTILDTITTLTSLQDTYQIAASKLSRLIEVYNLVRGENSQRVSFERYILIEYFERVIEAANLRLQKMTNGQFEFVRSDELASRGKQSGLDLDIYDAYTGEARDVKSLSGGEKFKASLSLSLGMADVIQAHQGGISINTLFIDEGFGSLDEESLQQAIDVLIDLQKSGRMIGIISHVEELKQSLPARIEVIKTPGGFSKTKIIVA